MIVAYTVDLKHLIYDPSTLSGPTLMISILLVTNDTFVAIQVSRKSTKAAIEMLFVYCTQDFSLVHFKSGDMGL